MVTQPYPEHKQKSTGSCSKTGYTPLSNFPVDWFILCVHHTSRAEECLAICALIEGDIFFPRPCGRLIAHFGESEDRLAVAAGHFVALCGETVEMAGAWL